MQGVQLSDWEVFLKPNFLTKHTLLTNQSITPSKSKMFPSPGMPPLPIPPRTRARKNPERPSLLLVAEQAYWKEKTQWHWARIWHKKRKTSFNWKTLPWRYLVASSWPLWASLEVENRVCYKAWSERWGERREAWFSAEVSGIALKYPGFRYHIWISKNVARFWLSFHW